MKRLKAQWHDKFFSGIYVKMLTGQYYEKMPVTHLTFPAPTPAGAGRVSRKRIYQRGLFDFLNWPFLFALGFSVFLAWGCMSKRVLNHPLEARGNNLAFVVYAENPAELLETGKDDTGKMGHTSFAAWLNDSLASGCNKYRYYYFDPTMVLAKAESKGVSILECLVLTGDGQPTSQPPLPTYPGSALPALFDVASDLGATHVVKVKFLSYFRKDYYRDDGKVKGDFVKLEFQARVTAWAVGWLQPVFDQPVSFSADNSMLFGDLTGGGNVKKALDAAIVAGVAPNPTPVQK